MANDIKSIFTDIWDATICTIGDMEYWQTIRHDPDFEIIFPINYGWCFKNINEDLHNSGMGSNAFQYTDGKGGDTYKIFMVGSDTEIDDFIKQYHHACDTFNTTGGNAKYDHLYPNSERMERMGPDHRRVLITTVMASRNNKAIYT